MELTNEILTPNRFAEIADTRILIRGRCRVWPGNVETDFELFTTHNSSDSRWLVRLDYHDHEPNRGHSLDARFHVEGWNDALSGFPVISATQIVERWRGSPNGIYWDRDSAEVLTLRGPGSREWQPAQPTHLHFMRHYTGIRAALAAELRAAPTISVKTACLTTCFMRFEGFLQKQLREWEKIAQNFA